MIGMSIMPAVKHMQKWAEKQKKEGPIAQQMRAMLGEEKEASNREEANQDKSASRREKAAFGLRLTVYMIMM